MTPLSDSQIYKLDEVHPPLIRFVIFLPYDNWTERRPVYNLQTGWHPIQFIRITICEPDVTSFDFQILKTENRIVLSQCPTKNFKII